MKKILNNPVLSLIARLLVAFFLFYAAIGKIADPQNFAKEIANYNIMMDETINLMALLLPWIELIIAIFLVVGIRLKASGAISSLMFLMFIGAIGIAMIQGLDIDCGCFAKSMQKVGWLKIAEDVGLLVCSLYIMFYPVKKLTLEGILKREI